MLEGRTNRVVGYRYGEFTDFGIEEALMMQKDIDRYQYEVARMLTI